MRVATANDLFTEHRHGVFRYFCRAIGQVETDFGGLLYSSMQQFDTVTLSYGTNFGDGGRFPSAPRLFLNITGVATDTTAPEIIEQTGGMTYEKFVQERVLKPAGISGPKLGATLTTAADEARYYTPDNNAGGEPVFPNLPDKVLPPYGAWCLETMDSHGGWIASSRQCGAAQI